MCCVVFTTTTAIRSCRPRPHVHRDDTRTRLPRPLEFAVVLLSAIKALAWAARVCVCKYAQFIIVVLDVCASVCVCVCRITAPVEFLVVHYTRSTTQYGVVSGGGGGVRGREAKGFK